MRVCAADNVVNLARAHESAAESNETAFFMTSYSGVSYDFNVGLNRCDSRFSATRALTHTYNTRAYIIHKECIECALFFTPALMSHVMCASVASLVASR